MSDLRRIIHVLDAAGSGGTEVYVEALMCYLSANGIQEVVALSGDQTVAKKQFPNHDVTVVDGWRGLRQLLQTLPKTTLVHLHLYSGMLPAVLLARRLNLTTFAYFHSPLANWSLRHKIAFRISSKLVKYRVGVSKSVISDFSGTPEETGWIRASGPLPMEILNRPAAVSRELGSEFHIVGVGRLSREKNWPTLVYAVSKFEDIHLTIFGEGIMHHELLALAKAHGVNLLLPGQKPHKELFACIEASDLFVLPSQFEGLGLAAVEAMALGVPVVTSDFPASSEFVIDGITGFRFPIGDVDVLAKLIEELKNDPELRGRIGKEGQAFARAKFNDEVQFGAIRAACER